MRQIVFLQNALQVVSTKGHFLFFPSALAILSLSRVSWCFAKRNIWNSKVSTKDGFLDDDDSSEGIAGKKGGFTALDGFSVFSYRLLNLFWALILLSLQIFKLSTQETFLAERLLVVFYIYTSIVAIAAIISNEYWRDQCDFHFSFLLFADFCVYFALDVWPYVTIHDIPYDWPGDITMWLRLSALTLSGLLIPLFAPRPFRPISPGMEPGIHDTMSLFNRFTYTYVDKLIILANRKPELSANEIPALSQKYRAAVFRKKNFPKLDPLLFPKKRHVIWGMLSAFRSRYIEMALWLTIATFSDFITPFALRNLLVYIETGEGPFELRPWSWIVLLILGPIITAVVFTGFFSAGFKLSVEGESTLTQLVFEHSLRIRLKTDVLSSKVDKKSDKRDAKKVDVSPTDKRPEEKAKGKGNQLIGKINNLVTTDISTINTSWNSAIIPMAIVQTAVAVAFLYGLLGWSIFAGYVAMAILVPISVLISKAMMKVQKGKMDKTDERVQSITESLGVIRMIKLFAWESFTVKKVNEKREAELQQVWKGKRLNVLLGCTNEAVPLLGKVTTFAVYALVMKGELTASKIFTSLMVFGLLEQNLFIVMGNLPNLLRLKVSLDRFTEFFNKTVYLDQVEETAVGQPLSSGVASSGHKIPEDKRDVIGFNSCRFSWDPFHELENNNQSTEDTREQFILDLDGEVTFKKNQFNIVVGSTASGKTSLLMALLGEMYFEPKDESSWWNLPREGGVAYAVQESWVLNKTIKDNIVFGDEFDEARYKLVLRQCALEKDISLWKAGDETEVGEKGLTLSGGQKARITLARALYSRASVLLLDDVLAALDVHTAKWVVNEALRGDLVEGRTIILVTHNIALVAPAADHVILMGKGGKAVATGTVSDVLRRDATLRKELESQKASTEDIEEKAEAITESEDKPASDNDAGKLVVAEEKAIGRVERAAFNLFFNAVGGPFVMSTFVFFHWLAMLLTIFERWFMGYWSSQYDYLPPDAIPVVRYIGILAIFNFSQLLGHALLGVFWILRCLRASRLIYSDLTRSIFSSTFRWLDVTPIGRIITRCTVDIDTIDGPFAQYLDPFIRVTLQVLTLFVSSVIMAGWSAVIPGLILMGLGGFLGMVYLKAQLSVRREMSNTKAPVINEIQAALASLPSIRAYAAQSKFRKEIQKKMDIYIRCSLSFYDINRWIGIRADSLGAFFAGTVATYLIYYSGLSAGSIGFTLNLVLSFSELILYWVRLYNTLELYGNSLERVLSYLRIDHEPANTESRKPPAYWPVSGDLRVEHLSARYSEDSPDVLHGISFEVKSGERVGIVGRTGAGKSSIALALLRAIKTDGKVYYDGLPTDTMNLDALRSNITLIPQQPELMRGTLRENLDPFGQLDDATLNSALQAAGLFDIQDMKVPEADIDRNNEPGPSSEVASSSSSVTDGNSSSADARAKKTKIGLDTQVDAGGTNFSLGQRQIIALARAIIRRSKLLILDEATAAIDYETDVAIQRALRTEFSKDSTFLIIAHRLQTIMDSDKIMVLDHGNIVEYDSPKVLIQNKDGYLRALVEESEDKDSLLKMIYN